MFVNIIMWPLGACVWITWSFLCSWRKKNPESRLLIVNDRLIFTLMNPLTIFIPFCKCQCRKCVEYTCNQLQIPSGRVKPLFTRSRSSITAEPGIAHDHYITCISFSLSCLSWSHIQQPQGNLNTQSFLPLERIFIYRFSGLIDLWFISNTH